MASAGSTAGAAALLHLTQSAVSRALGQAEQRVGVELFRRNARGLTPTTAGKRLLEGAGTILQQLAMLEQAVSAHPYIAGDRFTAADVYVGSTVGWGVQFGTLPRRNAFQAYYDRLSSRDAYKRANDIDNALAAEMEKAGA